MENQSEEGVYIPPWKDKHGREDYKGPGAAKQSTDKVLFSPLKLRDITLKNRIVVSPMCQYSSADGFMDDWHLVHLGSFATGGAALIFTEATAVTPQGRIIHICCLMCIHWHEGRISMYDVGLWKDEHIPMMKRIVSFIHSQKGLAGIQLAHAGRKASTSPPFFGQKGKLDDVWEPVGASPIPFDENWSVPHELTVQEIQDIVKAFVEATKRADKAGFDVVEIHGAHGYLISSFNSPLTNTRTDEYGGSFEGRTRFCVEVVKAVREAWPSHKPLWIRLSCSDWVEGGWDIEQTIKLAKILEPYIDVLDCSSGGQSPLQKIPVGPGYQVPFAEQVKKSDAKLHVATVGMITEPQQAEDIVSSGKADLVLIAREFLRQPNWPLHAAKSLGVPVDWPFQALECHKWCIYLKRSNK